MTENKNNYTVYVHISPSFKYYVGITRSKPERRWKNGKGYLNNQHFTNAINKHGWNSFQHEIVANGLTKGEACNFEKLLIKKLNSTNREYGYNYSIGGESGGAGYIRTEEHRKKISESGKGLHAGEKNAMFGKHHSKETKEKISESGKGRTHSDETKKKISEAHSGKTVSEESRRKISKSRKGKYFGENNPVSRKIYCLTTDEIFNSISQAANKYGFHVSDISRCCQGKRKSAGKSLTGEPMIWKNYNEDIDE